MQILVLGSRSPGIQGSRMHKINSQLVARYDPPPIVSRNSIEAGGGPWLCNPVNDASRAQLSVPVAVKPVSLHREIGCSSSSSKALWVSRVVKPPSTRDGLGGAHFLCHAIRLTTRINQLHKLWTRVRPRENVCASNDLGLLVNCSRSHRRCSRVLWGMAV